MANRRKFLQGIAAVSGAAVLSRFGDLPTKNVLAQQEELLSARELPTPERSGIDHIVVVMMENRSFDHLFGWIRHADGKQAGLTFAGPSGMPHSTHHLAGDFTGCGPGRESGLRSTRRPKALALTSPHRIMKAKS
jgi:phospholipase C